jgi:hypothetical protein
LPVTTAALKTVFFRPSAERGALGPPLSTDSAENLRKQISLAISDRHRHRRLAASAMQRHVDVVREPIAERRGLCHADPLHAKMASVRAIAP